MSPTHRESFPEQYRHPLAGKLVKVKKTGMQYRVERVCQSRFGTMLVVPGEKATAYRDVDVEIIQ